LTSQDILRTAFQNVAGHISNLEIVKQWVEELLSEPTSLENCINDLKSKSEKEDVTFRTDIRILINEIEHLSREKTSG
jgi:hypothetical protein